MVGSDGVEKFNKNRLDGGTQRDIPLGTPFIEVLITEMVSKLVNLMLLVGKQRVGHMIISTLNLCLIGY